MPGIIDATGDEVFTFANIKLASNKTTLPGKHKVNSINIC